MSISIIVCLIWNSHQIVGLTELPTVEDNNILTSEKIIQETTDKLFSFLKSKQGRSFVHKHLVSRSLEDYANLKKISKLTRVDKNINNETANFMTILNELLNEDPGAIVSDAENEDVVNHIHVFLDTLKYYKDIYGANKPNLHINEKIIQHLKHRDVPCNLTEVNKLNSLESSENETFTDESEFWEPSGRRIYMGHRTKIKYFPFMASIQIFNKFQCGGSIIKSDLVITAASCLQLAWNNRFFRENPAFLSVRVGSSFYSGGGENIPVLEVYFHPEYNPRNLRNNLCVLRLMRKLKFKRRGKKRVKKIDIDRKAYSLPLTTNGITIVGWGAKRSSNILNDPWTNIMSFDVLDVYPLDECQDIYSSEYVTKKHFCAGFVSKGGGACNRDVGGPGIVNGLLTGIISFGSPVCGTPDAPTVFTKIGHYSDWIEEIMEQDVPYIKKRTTLKLYTDPSTRPIHYTLAPTTFKIDPIEGAINSIPVTDTEVLRNLNDNGLINEFLLSMFGSKEVEEYQELFRNAKENNNKQEVSAKKNTVDDFKAKTVIDTATEIGILNKDKPGVKSGAVQVKMATEIDIVEPDSDEPVTKTLKGYTVLENEDLEKQMEQDIGKLINNIDMKEIAGEVKTGTEDVDEKSLINLLKHKRQNGKWKDLHDDSVLNLLYLSDSEKKKHNFDSSDNNDNVQVGLSIPTDSFKDITYRNNETFNVYEFLSKNELYDLLSKEIDAQTKI